MKRIKEQLNRIILAIAIFAVAGMFLCSCHAEPLFKFVGQALPDNMHFSSGKLKVESGKLENGKLENGKWKVKNSLFTIHYSLFTAIILCASGR